MSWWTSRDRGSGTVLAVGVVGVVLVMTVGGLMVVSAVVAGHRAAAAADLAALAAAAALVRGESVGSACEAGSAVAARNAASVTACQAGADLSVEVAVRVPATMPQVGVASARARAGPAPSGGDGGEGGEGVRPLNGSFGVIPREKPRGITTNGLGEQPGATSRRPG